ncbi:ribosomal protein L7/L12 [Amycolatopsis sp. NPDC005003]
MDYGTLSLALVVLVAVSWVSAASGQRQVARVERRLARNERKLDAIMAHLGIAEPEPELHEVRRLLGVGKKIEAIKVYRERTGAGLKEAKDAVEQLEA